MGEKICRERKDLNLVEWIVGSIDGEKDPRCLLTVFKIIPSTVELLKKTSAIEEAAEELFDVVSCYFPITDTGILHSVSPEGLPRLV